MLTPLNLLKAPEPLDETGSTLLPLHEEAIMTTVFSCDKTH